MKFLILRETIDALVAKGTKGGTGSRVVGQGF